MDVFSTFMRILVGLAFGALAALILSPGLAWTAQVWGGGGVTFSLVCILGGAFGLFAPNIRRAFGRGFLFCGVSFLALPLTMGLLSSQAASEVIAASPDSQASAIIGAGGGAMLVTGVASFVGIILGGIFVIIGLVLVLGGRREVIYVEKSAKAAREQPSVLR